MVVMNRTLCSDNYIRSAVSVVEGFGRTPWVELAKALYVSTAPVDSDTIGLTTAGGVFVNLGLLTRYPRREHLYPGLPEITLRDRFDDFVLTLAHEAEHVRQLHAHGLSYVMDHRQIHEYEAEAEAVSVLKKFQERGLPLTSFQECPSLQFMRGQWPTEADFYGSMGDTAWGRGRP